MSMACFGKDEIFSKFFLYPELKLIIDGLYAFPSQIVLNEKIALFVNESKRSLISKILCK